MAVIGGGQSRLYPDEKRQGFAEASEPDCAVTAPFTHRTGRLPALREL